MAGFQIRVMLSLNPECGLHRVLLKLHRIVYTAVCTFHNKINGVSNSVNTGRHKKWVKLRQVRNSWRIRNNFPLAFCKGAFSEVLQLEVIVVTPVSFMLICFLSPQNARQKALQPLSTRLCTVGRGEQQLFVEEPQG